MEQTPYDNQRNLMLAIGLMLAMWLVWMQFFGPKPEPVAEAGDGGTSAQVATGTPANSQGAPADGGPAIAAAPAVGTPSEVEHAAPTAPANPVKELTEETDLLRLRFSTEGAGLASAQLLGAKMREQPKLSIVEGWGRLFGKQVEDTKQMDMGAAHPDLPRPLAVSIAGERPFSAKTVYQVEQDEQNRSVRFTARQGNTEIVKLIQLPKEGFEAAMQVTVKNLGPQPLTGDLSVFFVRAVDPGSEEKASMFGGAGNESHSACHLDDEIHRMSPGGKDKSPDHPGKISFFGIDQQYFLSAVFPLDGAKDGRCVLNAPPTAREAEAAFALNVPPGGEQTFKYGVYIGPKDSDLLTSIPERMKTLGLVQSAEVSGSWKSGFQGSRYPYLEKSIDLGMWAFIAKILLGLLRFFHSLIANWGVAIILLTAAVKLAVLPLTHKSMVSAEQMKKLQPKMAEIRTKFADDKNRQNMEMMKLYQEAKVNPLGGCLPMLIQLPIWIALYTALRHSYEIYREPFISPIWTDLTYKDPTYILPIALGVTMIITQMLQPQMMADPVQAKVMTYVMPVFFTAIMLNYPAGLALYIFTNNLLTIVQQYLLRKYLQKKGIAAPPPPKNDKRLKRATSN